MWFVIPYKLGDDMNGPCSWYHSSIVASNMAMLCHEILNLDLEWHLLGFKYEYDECMILNLQVPTRNIHHSSFTVMGKVNGLKMSIGHIELIHI